VRKDEIERGEGVQGDVVQMDPNNDVIGSYGTGPGKKMYNHTCAEYEAGPVGQQQRAESIE
jgi:hypothetical protein